ncbi:hypothetical protein Tco_1481791 [Tanacetum coccineum]
MLGAFFSSIAKGAGLKTLEFVLSICNTVDTMHNKGSPLEQIAYITEHHSTKSGIDIPQCNNFKISSDSQAVIDADVLLDLFMQLYRSSYNSCSQSMLQPLSSMSWLWFLQEMPHERNAHLYHVPYQGEPYYGHTGCTCTGH